MTFQSKINTIFWYLRHPSYYIQLFNLIRQKIWGNPNENTREEATNWCKSKSIGTHDYLYRLYGLDLQEVTDLYPSVFEAARKASSKSPVKMGGPGNITLIYHICEYLKANIVIETGEAYGWSTLALLLSMTKRKESRLISIDLPYAKMDNEDYVGCVVADDFKQNWELIRQPDRKALIGTLVKLEKLDMCHYDSDKTYAGRMWAYPKLWEKLREGGFFISDDIGDNIAFKNFCSKIQKVPVVVRFQEQYVGIIQK